MRYILLLFLALLQFIVSWRSRVQIIALSKSRLNEKFSKYTDSQHESLQKMEQNRIKSTLSKSLMLISSLGLISSSNKQPARAIGDLYELKNQSMVLQGLIFNVDDLEKDIDMFTALFLDEFKVIRRSSSPDGIQTATLAFGPDAYSQPKNFLPGINSLLEYGGHTTITLKSTKLLNDGDVKEIYLPGDAFQYLKIAAENIRLSKAIANGATILSAYGYADLISPGGIPLEVVVGINRDPLVAPCLLVSNLAAMENFLCQELGMQPLPFPYTRTPGSVFERQPKDDEGNLLSYYGYSVDSQGILLLQKNTKATGGGNIFGGGRKTNQPPPSSRVNVGSQLESFNIVFDDRSEQFASLPPIIGKLYPELAPMEDRTVKSSSDNSKQSIRKAVSPDGYTFAFQPYSLFKQTATGSSEAFPAKK